MNKEVNEGKVKISEFLEKYKSVPESKIRKTICSQTITRQYVPAFEKYIALLTVFNHTCRKADGSLQYNNFIWTITFRMAILGLYTNLDIANQEEDSATFENYDSLKECGALNDLLSSINEEEIKEISTVREAIFADAEMNENNLVTLIKNFATETAKLSSDEQATA